MLDATGPACAACGTPLERVRYFPRQLITAEDMRAEQHYFREKMKRHNRFLHGFGVVCGCKVVPDPQDSKPWQVQVCPGYAVSPQGDEIMIPDPVVFDLQTGVQNQDPCTVTWPCPPMPAITGEKEQRIAYLAVRYAECATRPVRVHPAGCGCDQLDCEYSRIRDSFELKLLWALPDCYLMAKQWDAAWAQQVKVMRENIQRTGMIAPDCMPCCDEPWVVLATIRIPLTQTTAGQTTKAPIAVGDISTLDRRVLLSTEALQAVALAF
ncbi:MAG: hypothetical protein JSR21_04390 [Proteobacteria bacterium]|nr:hypothetical protein [Pseudomonadota bacterium]